MHFFVFKASILLTRSLSRWNPWTTISNISSTMLETWFFNRSSAFVGPPRRTDQVPSRFCSYWQHLPWFYSQEQLLMHELCLWLYGCLAYTSITAPYSIYIVTPFTFRQSQFVRSSFLPRHCAVIHIPSRRSRAWIIHSLKYRSGLKNLLSVLYLRINTLFPL